MTLLPNNFLLIIVLTGIILAISGAGIETNLTSHDDDWIVNVNGRDILLTDLIDNQNKVVKSVNQPDVLSMMIDNTLLIQRANELGIIDSDRVVKKAIVHSVIEDTVRQALKVPPTQAELKKHYKDNLNVFTSPSKVKLEIAKFTNLKDCQITHQTSLNWQANKIDHPASQGLMTEVLLSRIMGPTISKEIFSKKQGDTVLKPISIESNDQTACLGIHIKNYVPTMVQGFNKVKTSVSGEYRTDRRRQALANLLEKLKQDSDIKVSHKVNSQLSASADGSEYTNIAKGGNHD